jgi:hypothetical protein
MRTVKTLRERVNREKILTYISIGCREGPITTIDGRGIYGTNFADRGERVNQNTLLHLRTK